MTDPTDPQDRPRPDAAGAADLDLERFGSVEDEHGLSLDELSQTFADLIHGGQDPYRSESDVASRPGDQDIDDVNEDDDEDAEVEEPASLSFEDRRGEGDPREDREVTPKTILEAMLFVGHPENQPLGSELVASMMRGVSAAEIHELVEELNETYEQLGCPYEIRSVGAGYVMVIRDRYAPLRDKFHGKIRDAKLSQAAIDVLAIVAYNQPLTREEVDQLRGRPSGGLLRQLVRRQLLRVQRSEERPRTTRYLTTDRFLELFGMRNVGDLPQSQELD